MENTILERDKIIYVVLHGSLMLCACSDRQVAENYKQHLLDENDFARENIHIKTVRLIDIL